MQILLVDDDEDVLRSIHDYLTARGHQTETHSAATHAIASLCAGRVPDLVIADIQMPGMDGLELLGLIRRAHKDLHVILLTGNPTVETVIQALRGRATDYLTKPVDLDELRDCIERLPG